MSVNELIELLSLRPETSFVFVVLALFRPLGIMYGFTLFGWGLGQSLMLRIAIALPLGVLVFIFQSENFVEIAQTQSTGALTIIVMIEFIIGFGIGFIMSSPFFAFKYAGSVSDSFRGENNTGLQDESGGELSTFALLYFMTAAVIFCQFGGFHILFRHLLKSYTIWPVGVGSLELYAGSWFYAVQLIQSSLIMALVIAAPLLILFFFIELTLAVSSKLAPRFQLYENSFLAKNVAAILTLPLISYYILRISENNVYLSYDALLELERYFQ